MLDLYHWEPHGACARVMICLEEHGLQYCSRYVDVLAFEQYRPEFLQLNEAGQVPVLVHAGVPYTEASATCEYLEEAFAHPALMPSDPVGRWCVRVWQKFVDDGFAASVSDLAWEAYGTRGLRALALEPAALQIVLDRIPVKARREGWKAAVAGLGAERLSLARERTEAAIEKVETQLAESAWLAGSAYSLADIAVFAYLKYLPALCPNVLNGEAAPRATSWMHKIEARPAVRAALARGRAGDPFGVAAPGPEHVRWG
jgi:GSH-dependent disulfide-bond oxidoreductase